MATREKKAKASTDSPTPESTPSTPTTKTGTIPARSSRIRNRTNASRQTSNTSVAASAANDENEQSNDDEAPEIDDSVIDGIKTLTTPPATPTTAAKRKKQLEAKRAKKESETSGRPSRATSATPTTGARNSVRAKAADTEKLRKAGGIGKRKSLPILAKKGARAGAVDRRHSTSKIEMLKDTIAKETKGRPKKKVGVDVEEDGKAKRNVKAKAPDESPARKRRMDKEESLTPKTGKQAKAEKADTETDSDTNKLERGRSDSVSTKCSDITDISTICEKDGMPTIKDETASDDQMSKSKVLDKMAESFEKKMSEIVPVTTALVDSKIRRSTRPRKSTFKEKEKEQAAAPKTKIIETKTEPVVASVASENDADVDEAAEEFFEAKSSPPTPIPTSPADKIPPLHIETNDSVVNDGTATEAAASDASGTPEQQSPATTQASLSPQLVSEGVSITSVKKFFAEPAFLENNLGIEEDPKLAGELVQAHEKNKIEPNEKLDNCVKSESDKKVENEVDNASDEKLEVEKEELKDESVETKDDSVVLKSETKTEEEEEEKKVETETKAKSKTPSPAKRGKSPTKLEKVVPMMALEEVKMVIGVAAYPSAKVTSPAEAATRGEDNSSTKEIVDGQRKDEEVEKIDESEKTEAMDTEEDDVSKEENLSSPPLFLEVENDLNDSGLEDSNTEKSDGPPNLTPASTPIKATQAKSPLKVLSPVEKTPEKVKPAADEKQANSDEEKLEEIKQEVDEEDDDTAPKTKPVLNKKSTPVKKSPPPKSSPIKLTRNAYREPEKIVASAKTTPAKQTSPKTQKTAKDPEPDLQISPEKLMEPLVVTPIKSDSAMLVDETTKENKAEAKNKIELPKIPSIKLITATAAISVVAASTPATPNTAKDEKKVNDIKVTLTPVTNESAEILKQKESHLLSLGLLTLKAAKQAKIEKLKRKEALTKKPMSAGSHGAGKHGKGQKVGGTEYTGTLKIKLKRPKEEKRNLREPLKMTIQKKQLKGTTDKHANGEGKSENTFYTIQNEGDVAAKDGTEGTHGGQSRKSHNRSHISEPVAEVAAKEPAKEVEKDLVIPEKASSFKVHPDRLCQDQCFYCGGKFGLYDTPCHIAQIKSVERQEKILRNEEKLTSDNCLCDACFRHVDRRANCPSYKKRLCDSAVAPEGAFTTVDNEDLDAHSHSENSSEASVKISEVIPAPVNDLMPKPVGQCCVTSCLNSAPHTLRRKWFSKLKLSTSKRFRIDLDINTAQAPRGHLLAICEPHYEAISHLMVCAMCRRRLQKNHIFYIHQETRRLEKLINEQGIQINLNDSSLVVCKLCRYYANMLLKPPSENKAQKIQFIKNYGRKLLQYNSFDDNSAMYADNNEDTILVDDDVDVECTPTKKHYLNLPRFVGSGTSEVTITPNYKSATMTTSTPATGHMMLDNDVMVDYDPPMIDGSGNSLVLSTKTHHHHHHHHNKQQTAPKQKHVDPSSMLKANPQISMRELFPGEEELGLHVQVPFNSLAMRTPEGWTRVSTNLQYDDQTRLLWEELQKPYGNQSSFLRHLILLERYYRNGDLVLSQNASSSAISYSESVQNRLRSYDNVPPQPAAPAILPVTDEETNNILRQMSNSSITIIPTTKAKPKPISEGSETSKPGLSLLQRKAEKKTSKEPTAGPPSKIPRLDEMTITPTTAATTPPKRNVSTPPPPTEPTKANGSGKKESGSVGKKASPAGNTASTQSVIQLPDSLNEKERKHTAKPWRPTLIPITAGSVKAAMSGPLYQTADGRKLPALVQVMSGGKPYHISIHDYNRMCLLRREKLLQQQQIHQQQEQRQQQQQQIQQMQQKQQQIMQYQQNMQHFQQMQQNAINKRQSPPSRSPQQKLPELDANSSALATAKMNLMHLASQQMQMQQQQQQQQLQGQGSATSITPRTSTSTASATITKPATVTSDSASTSPQSLDPEIPVNVINKSLYLNNSSSSSRNPTLGGSGNEMNLGGGMSVTARDSSGGGSKVNKTNKNQNSLLKSFTQKGLHLPNSTSVLPLPPGPPSTSSTALMHLPLPFPPNTTSALMQLSAMTGSGPSSNSYHQSMPPPSTATTYPHNVQSAMDALIKQQQQSSLWGLWHDNSALSGGHNNSGNNSTATNNSGGSMLAMDNSAATLLSKIPKSLTVIPQQKSRSQRTSSNEERPSNH